MTWPLLMRIWPTEGRKSDTSLEISAPHVHLHHDPRLQLVDAEILVPS